MFKTLLTICILLAGCSYFEKPNRARQVDNNAPLAERDALYCELSKPAFEAYGTTENDCDAALFTSLHALKCGYIDPKIFEYESSGRLCRRPGCTCFPRQEGQPSSDSTFSKDMATGMQVYYSAKPDKDLADRVGKYLNDNKFFACQTAETPEDLAGKCLMSPKIVYRWEQIKSKGLALTTDSNEPNERALTQNTEFRAHLDILSVIIENNLYGGISDDSLKTVKFQAEREPNNLLYQAMLARFVTHNEKEVANKLLAKFPDDRLPNSDDWCTSYLFQRDETRSGQVNPDWLPCPERGETHPGTDYLLTSWVLQMEAR